MTRIEEKLTLVKVNYSMKGFNLLKPTEFEHLSETAHDHFNFIESFRRLHKLKDSVFVWTLENRIKKIEILAFGPFQIYLLDNIFIPHKNSEIQKHKNRTKKQ